MPNVRHDRIQRSGISGRPEPSNTQTHTMKSPEEMTRFELYSELARYMHPIAFQAASGYTTPVLAAMLTYHTAGKRARVLA